MSIASFLKKLKKVAAKRKFYVIDYEPKDGRSTIRTDDVHIQCPMAAACQVGSVGPVGNHDFATFDECLGLTRDERIKVIKAADYKDSEPGLRERILKAVGL